MKDWTNRGASSFILIGPERAGQQVPLRTQYNFTHMSWDIPLGQILLGYPLFFFDVFKYNVQLMYPIG